jgi:hypothetical protein
MTRVDPRAVHVRFMSDKVSQEQTSLWIPRLFPVIIIPTILRGLNHSSTINTIYFKHRTLLHVSPIRPITVDSGAVFLRYTNFLFSRCQLSSTDTLRRPTLWLQLTATFSPCTVFHTVPRRKALRHRGGWYSFNMVCCPVLWTGSSWDQERDWVRLNSDSIFLNSCQNQ